MKTPMIYNRSMSEQVHALVLDTRLNNACATIYTRAAQPRLWMDLGGRVACLTHGGGYLQYAVEAQPTAREHVTPLTAWVSADGRGFPCEDCGMEDAPGATKAPSCVAFSPTTWSARP